MKHLKTYESFDNNNVYIEYAEYYTNEYYRDNSHFNYEEILDRLLNFVETDFPYGLNNLPETITLYRLLNVDSEDDINKDNLGKHYVGDSSMLDDEDFLYSASILSGNDEIKKWFIVEIETNEDNLDIDNILGNRAEYPTEFEFTLKNDKNLNIINIKEIDNSVYK